MDENKHNTVRSAKLSATKVTDRNGQTANKRDINLRSEVTVTRKMMVLAVIGPVLLSTLISVIAGMNVYHVTIDKMADKMADNDKQDQDRASTTFPQYQTDALTLKAKELKNNVTAASDEWNKEMKSLKTFVSEIERNLHAASDERTILSSRLTTASDTWNEEMASLKNNVSELDRNITAASDEWNEEMMSLKTNVSELARNLTSATDVWNEASARHYSKDCSELYAAGTVVDGVYTISPDGRIPFQVYCDMTGGGWTLIQKRIDGLVRFNRTWQEYEEGFGNIDGEHWLGLDNIHRLTAEGSEIYFHLEYHYSRTGSAHYQAFSVHGAQTAYRMNVDAFGYKGTIPEIFSLHNNMMFSTYDRDNDNKTYGNCAAGYRGGYWFNRCYGLGNVNGEFGRKTWGGIAYFHKGNHLLKSVYIKIRPSPGY